MSWKRAFQQIYTKYNWLNSFAQINQIAIQRLLSEIALNLLQLGNNSHFTHQFNQFITGLPLENKKQEVKEIKELMNYFALAFTGKNFRESKLQLENTGQIRTKDLVPISVLLGINFCLFSFIAFIFQIPSKSIIFILFLSTNLDIDP